MMSIDARKMMSFASAMQLLFCALLAAALADNRQLVFLNETAADENAACLVSSKTPPPPSPIG